MKRTFLLLLIISFTSCGNLTKPKITDEVFEPTIDSLYTQCRDLKGLGKLHIGNTTLWQAKRDKGITISGYSRTPSFVGGYWGANILYDEFDMGEYLNKKATTIKQWEITDIANNITTTANISTKVKPFFLFFTVFTATVFCNYIFYDF